MRKSDFELSLHKRNFTDKFDIFCTSHYNYTETPNFDTVVTTTTKLCKSLNYKVYTQNFTEIPCFRWTMYAAQGGGKLSCTSYITHNNQTKKIGRRVFCQNIHEIACLIANHLCLSDFL